MEPSKDAGRDSNETVCSSSKFRNGVAAGVVAGIALSTMSYCLGNLLSHARRFDETLQVQPNQKIVQPRKKEKQSIPKKEYEEWLKEHRRSQDGHQIGNGG